MSFTDRITRDRIGSRSSRYSPAVVRARVDGDRPLVRDGRRGVGLGADEADRDAEREGDVAARVANSRKGRIMEVCRGEGEEAGKRKPA